VAVIPAIELTPDELVPYKIGYRLADKVPPEQANTSEVMTALTLWMTPKERRDLVPLGWNHSACWMMVGCMVAHLDAAIAAARTV
jgi:hypothetical protein